MYRQRWAERMKDVRNIIQKDRRETVEIIVPQIYVERYRMIV